MRTFIIISTFMLFASLTAAEQKRTLEKSVPVQLQQQVLLQGFHGSQMRLMSWDKQEVGIKIFVTISGGDEEQEKEFLNNIGIRTSADQNNVAVVFERPNELRMDGMTGFFRSLFGKGNFSKQISGEIYLPRNNAVASDMRYATIELSGMKGTVSLTGVSNTITIVNCGALKEIENKYGRISIVRSGGALKLLSSSSESIRIEDFSGSVHIDADYSLVSVSKVSGDVSINNVSGEIAVSDVRANVTIDGDYSPVSVHNAGGTVSVDTRSSSMVRIDNVKGLTVRAPYSEVVLSNIAGDPGSVIGITNISGSIDLRKASGAVMIDANYTRITLLDVTGNVDLKTRSAQVEAESIKGNWKSVSEYSTLNLTALQSTAVSVVNSSDQVVIHCAAVPASVTVVNTYGNVEVKVPQGFSGEIQLEAKYGTIETDFPVRTKSLGGGSYAVGKVGNGSGSIEIETTSGNISVSRTD